MTEYYNSVDGDELLNETREEMAHHLQDALVQIEILKQDKYTLKRQLDVANKTAKHMGEEVEMLQNLQKQQEEKTIQQVHKVEEQSKREISLLTNKIELLEDQLEAQKTEYLKSETELKLQLSDSQKKVEIESNVAELMEIENLKEQKEALKKALEESAVPVVELRHENEVLRRRNTDLYEERKDLQEALSSKREELISCSQCITDLREELAMNVHTIDMLKTAPAEADRKGNSVFAEVEDNRQALKRKMDSMAVKYKRLKDERELKNKEISTLMAKNVSLHRQIQEVQADFSSESHLVSSYLERIKDLEDALKKQKAESNSVRIVEGGDSDGFQWLESMLKSKCKENEALKAEAEERSVSHLMRSDALFRVERELKAVRAQLLQSKAEQERLAQLLQTKQELVSPDDVKPVEEAKENTSPKRRKTSIQLSSQSVKRMTTKSDRLTSDKVAPAKIFRFSEDTIEPSTNKPTCVSKKSAPSYTQLYIGFEDPNL